MLVYGRPMPSGAGRFCRNSGNEAMPNSRMSGSEIVLKALEDQGVDVIFGYPGGAVLPLYDALFQQNRIRHVLVRHEQGAGSAVDVLLRGLLREPKTLLCCALLPAYPSSCKLP